MQFEPEITLDPRFISSQAAVTYIEVNAGLGLCFKNG
jgi:hypothetical protein